MKTTKMSLANIQGKLSRAEMKKIMAGVAAPTCSGSCDFTWTGPNGQKITTPGTCMSSGSLCYCSSGEGQC